MNDEADAIKNGLEQTNSDSITINFNPSRGIVADLLESAQDTLGIGTSGMAKDTGEFLRDTSTARGDKGTNYVNHSQGNSLTNNGVNYIKNKGGYKDGGFDSVEYFKDGTKTNKEGKTKQNIPTFAGFGSHINTDTISGTLKKVNFSSSGMITHKDDFVGEALGGNDGTDEQRTIVQKVTDKIVFLNPNSIKNIIKLFTDDSPHSTYNCEENPNIQCGDRP